MHSLRFLSWLFLVIACVAHTPSATEASQELRDKLTGLADNILKNTKQQPVTIGQFTPTGLANTNNGPGIEQLLTQALNAKVEGIVKAGALFEVKGDYSLVASKVNPELKVIKIISRLFSIESGEELKELRLDVELSQNKTIAEVLQVTASLDPNGSQVQRNKEIQNKSTTPAVHIHGANNTLVSTTANSPYSVELLVKPNDNEPLAEAGARKAESENGVAMVPITENELYEVKIYNNSKKPVAV